MQHRTQALWLNKLSGLSRNVCRV